MLSTAEQAVLSVFEKFMVSPGEMLCFHGPMELEHGASLRRLIEQKLLVKEQFKDGYSLTDAGYVAMRQSCSAVK
jgi:hypothetical protein